MILTVSCWQPLSCNLDLSLYRFSTSSLTFFPKEMKLFPVLFLPILALWKSLSISNCKDRPIAIPSINSTHMVSYDLVQEGLLLTPSFIGPAAAVTLAQWTLHQLHDKLYILLLHIPVPQVDIILL